MGADRRGDPREGIDPASIHSYFEFAWQLADDAREMSRLSQGARARRKDDGSVVTDVDLRIERRLRERIVCEHPGHGVIGEELGEIRADADLRWVIDPLDGTEDFARGIPTYGTLIALEYRGRPLVSVVDHPALDIRSSAAFKQGAHCNGSRLRLNTQVSEAGPVILPAFADFAGDASHAGGFRSLVEAFPNYRVFRNCYGHTLVFTGAADAAVEFGVRWWDVAATRLIIEEAGGLFASGRLDIRPPGRYVAVFGKRDVVSVLRTSLSELFSQYATTWNY